MKLFKSTQKKSKTIEEKSLGRREKGCQRKYPVVRTSFQKFHHEVKNFGTATSIPNGDKSFKPGSAKAIYCGPNLAHHQFLCIWELKVVFTFLNG